jgi:hypothetical protein
LFRRLGLDHGFLAETFQVCDEAICGFVGSGEWGEVVWLDGPPIARWHRARVAINANAVFDSPTQRMPAKRKYNCSFPANGSTMSARMVRADNPHSLPNAINHHILQKRNDPTSSPHIRASPNSG